MYAKAIQKIFERLVEKHKEKGESFRILTGKRLDEILCDEMEEWANTDNEKDEIEELCDIVVASIIKIEWLIQGGQK